MTGVGELMLLTILGSGGAALAVGLTAASWYAWNNVTYARRDASRASKAGFVERQITLHSGTTLTYSEGPGSGVAVLLLHGQGSARQSYDRVLPALAKDFHVYTLDVAGHGQSDRTPHRYTVHQIGADVVDFIDSAVGEPIILSGHSSGGLIAAWVAAEAPHLVSAVLFADAPFFSTEADRFATQFNFVDLAVPAHEFLAQDVETDFASWYIAHNAWIGYFRGGRDGIVRYARKRRAARPDEPLRLWFLPPLTSRMRTCTGSIPSSRTPSTRSPGRESSIRATRSRESRNRPPSFTRTGASPTRASSRAR